MHVHTLGTAIKGEADGVLWDNEFGYQFGKNPDGSDISAYSLTFGLGAKATGTMKPTLWMYYDWASGDDSINNGWNQLFPLGHKYLGFMDFFGRRNIHDMNSILTFNPTEKFTVLAWYHYLFLANGAQGPYNITNSAFNPGGTVGSRDLGHEIDLLGTYKVNARSDLVLGYSHFFTGKYYDTSLTSTGAVGAEADIHRIAATAKAGPGRFAFSRAERCQWFAVAVVATDAVTSVLGDEDLAADDLHVHLSATTAEV